MASSASPIDERTWQHTLENRRFDFAGLLRGEPQPISVDEIAWCLSHKYRYGGHTRILITVAEHSLAVARRVRQLGGDRNETRCALLHDAHEAYIGDMISPLKALLRERGETTFERIDAAATEQIAAAFGVDWTDRAVELVRQADAEAMAWERTRIKGPPPAPWPGAIECPADADVGVLGLSPVTARTRWLGEIMR